MRIVRIIFYAAALSTLPACIGNLVQPDSSEPHANLRLVWGSIPGVAFNGYQGYFALSGGPCGAQEHIASLGTMFGKAQDVRLTPVPITLLAHAHGASGAPSGSCGAAACYSTTDCAAVVTFTPEAGHSYIAQQQFVNNRCPLALIDGTTGVPPPSLRRHAKVDVACRPETALKRWVITPVGSDDGLRPTR